MIAHLSVFSKLLSLLLIFFAVGSVIPAAPLPDLLIDPAPAPAAGTVSVPFFKFEFVYKVYTATVVGVCGGPDPDPSSPLIVDPDPAPAPIRATAPQPTQLFTASSKYHSIGNTKLRDTPDPDSRRYRYKSFLFILPSLMVTMDNFVPFTHELSVSCINCNSLNSSLGSDFNRNLKVNGITKLGSDVIFLSDTRLGNKSLVSCAEEVSKLFATNLNGSYDFFFNSTRNKRGVGILLNKSLPFSVQEQKADREENFLLLKVLLRGETIILGSVYGPNNQNLEFFHSLKRNIRSLSENNSIPVLLGGDWNCTLSADPVDINIDTYNMRSLPNLQHSLILNEMCNDLDLIDPFRLLHFDKIDFSYAPRSEAMRNKSRIDFFLISGGLSRRVNQCHICPTLQNRLFDHRAVNLTVNAKRIPKKKGLFIMNKILGSDLLDAVVYSSVADTYLHHIIPPQGFNREMSLGIVGTIKALLRSLGIDFRQRPGYTPTEEELAQREESLLRLRYLVSTLNIPWLEGLEKSVDIDIFMETLINNVRNDVTSYQSFFIKEKRKEFDAALEALVNFKKNYAANDEKIRLIEKKLNDLADSDMRTELENYALFEHISAEKMSPKFLELAKLEKIEAKLTDIKNSDGTPFLSDSDRKSYITKYFADIYKKQDAVNPYEGCIEDFLGPEILQNPVVREAKIPDNLRAEFELPLTGHELDKAVEELSSGSAGGPDGLSVKFVKKYWAVFKKPLTDYASFCINKGELTQSFSTASIKLIPKKGDISNIKNWRPISLLNVLYKVMSKALNNRLKKISGKIVTRSQKGFVDKRYIQECLINIIETVNYGNSNNIPSFCLALDQKKAFDSVSHQFMTEVYKFFGFGNQFINMINVLTTGRSACVIWDDGTFSENIPLGGGHTQGNGPSPLLFDFCQQILLFKLEFAPEIISILPPRLPALMGPGEEEERALAPAHQGESGTGTGNGIGQGNDIKKDDKVETFADDATLLARANREAALAVKRILTLFFVISGLECNFEKSTIMFFGFPGNLVPEWAGEIGFQVVSKTKILGCEIESDLSKLTNNFDTTLKKIRNLKLFWSRFNLSLPGRIGVAKSLMLAQINYLGCVLTPTDRQLDCMYNLIADFIKGRANIGKERIFFETSHGGTGMIDLRNYIIGQQCSWVKRLSNGKKDTYKDILLSVGFDKPGAVKPGAISQLNMPVLGSIENSFSKFYDQFLRVNGNWQKSSVLYNPLLKNNRAEPVVNESFVLHNRPPITTNEIFALKVGDIWSNGRLKSLDEINERLPVQLSLVSYMRLGESSRYWDKKTLSMPVTGLISKSINDFLIGFKKGSKQFRSVLNNKMRPKMEKYAEKAFRNFLSCCGLHNIQITGKRKFVFDWWSHHFMPNRMRDFIFKFVSNTLNVNARLANFVEQADASCTFCKMEGFLPVERESFAHLFFECPITASLHNKVLEKYLPNLRLNNEIERRALWLMGVLIPAEINFSLFLQVLIGTVNFYIWESKIKKCKLSWSSCETFCQNKIDDMLKISKKLEYSLREFNIQFFRDGRDE
jgi:exonuclease III